MDLLEQLSPRLVRHMRDGAAEQPRREGMARAVDVAAKISKRSFATTR